MSAFDPTFDPEALERQACATLPAATQLQGRFPAGGSIPLASENDWQRAMTDLHFGTNFSDHMAAATWSAEAGWHDRQLLPFGPITLSPAAAVLHYGQEIFEGLKAYRHADGSIWTFRPGYNAARFNQSAQRMSMPQLPIDDFLASIVDLVTADQRWVPTQPGTSLYLRPFMFASEAFLGVHAARHLTYLLIASPVGNYFTNGLQPVSIWVSSDYHRAGPGGTGAAKTGGNYAGAMLAQEQAAQRGFDQVCFLDATTNSNLEELGGMNVFVVYRDGRVATPKLSGTILAGGTRGAIITLLRDRGIDVAETTINAAALVDSIRSGEISEMFACGTAAVVVPIGRLAGRDFDVQLPGGDFTASVYRQLTDLQNGVVEDPYGWTYRIV